VQIQLFREFLKDLTPAEMKEAVSHAILNCKFMPTIAELRSFAGRSAAQQKQLETAVGSVAAEREWEAVLAHVNRYGGTVYPGDPKLLLSAAGEYAFRQIGWRDGLLNTAPEDLHWAHKEFVAAYTMHGETGGLLAPSREEARRLLASLHGERKELPGRATGGT
jgi:hypothetical protein